MPTPRISLPIEIKQRELRGKLWLALTLVKRGHTVALGGKDDIFTAFDILEPDVHIESGPVAHTPRIDRMKGLQDCGVTVLLLDTEGGALKPGAYRDRVDKRVLSLCDMFLAWGEASGDIAAETLGSTDRVRVVGNPRFDLLAERLREQFTPAAAGLQKEYGKYILINTSFGVNSQDRDTLQKHTQHDDAVFQHQAVLIGRFIEGIGALADANPDQSIVVRPHPVEDTRTYEQLLWPFKNVVVTKSGDVTPWLLGSKVVVHNSCTTGIEATLLEKPVIAYEPTNRVAHHRRLPNLVSEIASTPSELVDAVNAADGRRPIDELRDDQRKAVEHHFVNLNGGAADRIANIVDDLKPVHIGGFSEQFPPKPALRMKRLLLRTIGQKRYRRYYREGIGRRVAFENPKFGGLSIQELEAELTTLARVVDIDGILITPVAGVENTFWVKRDGPVRATKQRARRRGIRE